MNIQSDHIPVEMAVCQGCGKFYLEDEAVVSLAASLGLPILCIKCDPDPGLDEVFWRPVMVPEDKRSALKGDCSRGPLSSIPYLNNNSTNTGRMRKWLIVAVMAFTVALPLLVWLITEALLR